MIGRASSLQKPAVVILILLWSVKHQIKAAENTHYESKNNMQTKIYCKSFPSDKLTFTTFYFRYHQAVSINASK